MHTEVEENQEKTASYLGDLIAAASKTEAFHEAMWNKAKELEKTYPDFLDFRVYHLLIGSTPIEPCSKFDFPGEDSIISFLEKYLVEHPRLDESGKN